MSTITHRVVGVIDVPAEGYWSADALVQSCLDAEQADRTNGPVLVARPRGGSPGSLAADTRRLRRDLDRLLSQFLVRAIRTS